jgi:hypothetical protein
MNKDVVCVTGIDSQNLEHSTLKGFTVKEKKLSHIHGIEPRPIEHK